MERVVVQDVNVSSCLSVLMAAPHGEEPFLQVANPASGVEERTGVPVVLQALADIPEPKCGFQTYYIYMHKLLQIYTYIRVYTYIL